MEDVKKGGISVETEHIFPIIKKWLYSDKDIFLREIVSNACDAVTKLRRLSSLGQVELNDDYRITVKADKEAGTITVSDNGIGIKETNMQKIFVPFFTTKTAAKSGTGIGMYIVKRIITENLKGKIELKSVYMKGTDFTIELPNELPKV